MSQLPAFSREIRELVFFYEISKIFTLWVSIPSGSRILLKATYLQSSGMGKEPWISNQRVKSWWQTDPSSNFVHGLTVSEPQLPHTWHLPHGAALSSGGDCGWCVTSAGPTLGHAGIFTGSLALPGPRLPIPTCWTPLGPGSDTASGPHQDEPLPVSEALSITSGSKEDCADSSQNRKENDK